MRRSPAALALIVADLLAISVFLIWFGVEDLSEALAYTGRFTGALLVLGAATTLLGAVAALDHWYRHSFPYSGLVALLGTVTAAVAGVMLLIATLRDGDSTAYIVVWCLIVLGSVWASITVYRTAVTIPAPKRVAAAVIASSAIAIANFGYTQLYQPYQRAALPVMQMSLGQPVLKPDGRAFAVPIHISMENRGHTGLIVLGAECHAMGRTEALSSADQLAPNWGGDVAGRHQVSRRGVWRPDRMVAVINWITPGTWLEPGETFVTDRVIELPVDTPYDQLSAHASASIARKDRLSLEQEVPEAESWMGGPRPPAWLGIGRDDYVRYGGRIHENNSIAEHTRDPRYVTVWWVFGDDGGKLIAIIDRKGAEVRQLPVNERIQVESRYGFSSVMTGLVVRSLWDVKNRR